MNNLECLYCGNALSNPKAKFCSDKHRMAYKRGGKTRTKVINVTVNNPNIVNPNKEPEQEWRDFDKELYYTGGIDERILEVLKEIYKKFEKENKPFKCIPYTVKGQQVLTMWERMKLKEVLK